MRLRAFHVAPKQRIDRVLVIAGSFAKELDNVGIDPHGALRLVAGLAKPRAREPLVPQLGDVRQVDVVSMCVGRFRHGIVSVQHALRGEPR